MAVQNLKLISSDKTRIKVAIVGMGQMGKYHFNALQQLKTGKSEDYYKNGVEEQLSKLEIVGVCDICPSQLENYDTISKFTYINDMLSNIDADILIIASPTESHKKIAALALAQGIHTFVEKPIVTSVADLDSLLAISADTGTRLMAGHVERYNPVSVKIKAFLEETTSAIKNYSFKRIQSHSQRITDDIIVDKVIHDLDLSINFFGRITDIKIDSVEKVAGKPYRAKLNIKHENGVVGELLVSWLEEQNTKCRQVCIGFENGDSWRGDFVSKQLWVNDNEHTCYVSNMITPVNNQIKDELVDFIASCINNADLQQIVPLLLIEEIAESTKWLEFINKKGIYE